MSRGFDNCAEIVGVPGPMSEYNSLDILPGFFARSTGSCGLRIIGPVGLGSDRMLRTSAADAPAILKVRSKPNIEANYVGVRELQRK